MRAHGLELSVVTCTNCERSPRSEDVRRPVRCESQRRRRRVRPHNLFFRVPVATVISIHRMASVPAQIADCSEARPQQCRSSVRRRRQCRQRSAPAPRPRSCLRRLRRGYWWVAWGELVAPRSEHPRFLIALRLGQAAETPEGLCAGFSGIAGECMEEGFGSDECRTWDNAGQSAHDICSQALAPAWCSQQWCYVDSWSCTDRSHFPATYRYRGRSIPPNASLSCPTRRATA